MRTLSVVLFGKFSISDGGSALLGVDVRKVQELLSYLLLFRGRAHTREALATLLWSDTSTAQSRKYLRKALWQLQSALRPFSSETEAAMLAVDQDWIRLERCPHLRLDVAQFEEDFARAG